jgi:hypothetical protein
MVDFNDSTASRERRGWFANESARENGLNVKVCDPWLSFIHSTIKGLNVWTFVCVDRGQGHHPSFTLGINLRSVFKPVAAHGRVKLHSLPVKLLAVCDELTDGRLDWLLWLRRL